MSNVVNLNQCRRSRSGGMHPGWECALCMFGSGIMVPISMVSTWQWAALQEPFWLMGITWIIWMALFIRGGKLAERLRPDPRP